MINFVFNKTKIRINLEVVNDKNFVREDVTVKKVEVEAADYNLTKRKKTFLKRIKPNREKPQDNFLAKKVKNVRANSIYIYCVHLKEKIVGIKVKDLKVILIFIILSNFGIALVEEIGDFHKTFWRIVVLIINSTNEINHIKVHSSILNHDPNSIENPNENNIEDIRNNLVNLNIKTWVKITLKIQEVV